MTERKNIDIDQIALSIRLIKQYVDDDSVKPLISRLEALEQDPENESRLLELYKTFNSLGIVQGAVLTYAPYLITLLLDDPLGFKAE